jgi:hypothetical protein
MLLPLCAVGHFRRRRRRVITTVYTTHDAAIHPRIRQPR